MSARAGDTAVCVWCDKPIVFWKGNPPRLPGVWQHVRDYPAGFREAFGAHPSYCVELQAVPKR